MRNDSRIIYIKLEQYYAIHRNEEPQNFWGSSAAALELLSNLYEV